jgi:dipeptidyl aminopeptidase/acylaminoacyl peptidase
MDYEDIMDGAGYLVDEGIADPERLAIGGWSYGGYMSEWAVTHSSRFKAAVSGAGVADLFSQAGTTDITPTYFQNYFLEGPFRRRANYEQHSPITFIENCRTPILVLHGESDERVPVAQSMQFYNGVKMLGLKPEMVTYPREHHGIIERDHQIDLLLRVLDWYDIHLK